MRKAAHCFSAPNPVAARSREVNVSRRPSSASILAATIFDVGAAMAAGSATGRNDGGSAAQANTAIPIIARFLPAEQESSVWVEAKKARERSSSRRGA
jgi:hypothetical protein